MKQFFITQLVVWFGWLFCVALVEIEISGMINDMRGNSSSFPHVRITSLGNLAVFVTSLMRKRLELEMGARDFVATIIGLCILME